MPHLATVALHEIVITCRTCGAETTVHVDGREPATAERFTPCGDAETLCGHLTTADLEAAALETLETERAERAEWARAARRGQADLW